MSSRPILIRTFCELSTDSERLLERAMTQPRLSAGASTEPKHIAMRFRIRACTGPIGRSPVSIRRSDISPPQGEITRFFRRLLLVSVLRRARG